MISDLISAHYNAPLCSQDSDAIDQYYRIVKLYDLPWCSNIYLQTVHRSYSVQHHQYKNIKKCSF